MTDSGQVKIKSDSMVYEYLHIGVTQKGRAPTIFNNLSNKYSMLTKTSLTRFRLTHIIWNMKTSFVSFTLIKKWCMFKRISFENVKYKHLYFLLLLKYTKQLKKL